MGSPQSYITDRFADVLLNSGIERALVDMGEIRALGDRQWGEPWRVGIKDPIAPSLIAETVEVRNLAIATSGGYFTRFDPAGHFNHIFDPKTGLTSSRYLSVSVIAPLAATADALSTAFSLMPLDLTQGHRRKARNQGAFCVAGRGRISSNRFEPGIAYSTLTIRSL